MRLVIAAVAALGVAAISPSASAKRGVVHKVRKSGETYANIAEHYYGHRRYERHLRAHTGKKSLARGTQLIIPTYHSIVLPRGHSINEFAAAHLHDEALGPYVVALHNLGKSERKRLRKSKRMKVVRSIGHRVRRGESLRSIARQYYTSVDRRRLRLLRLFNKMPSSSLRGRRRLRIPLDEHPFGYSTVLGRSKVPFRIRKVEEVAKAPPPPVVSPAPPPARSGSPSVSKELSRKRLQASRKRLKEELERAGFLYREGEYEKSAEIAADVLTRESPSKATKTRVELLRVLAFSQIALAEVAESKVTFKKLLSIQPKYELDLYTTSPKIRKVFDAVALR